MMARRFLRCVKAGREDLSFRKVSWGACLLLLSFSGAVVLCGAMTYLGAVAGICISLLFYSLFAQLIFYSSLLSFSCIFPELGYIREGQEPLPADYGDRRRLYSTVLNKRRFVSAGDLVFDVELKKIKKKAQL